MKASKIKKPKTTAEDLDALKNDVASFASSLGLATSASPTSTAGFDDSDFRKTGPLKPRHQPTPKTKEKSNTNNNILNPKSKSNNENQHKSKPPTRARPEAQFGDGNNLWNEKERYNNLPKLPLVKASGLGVWHVDAAELEEKVFGGEGKKRTEIRNVEEWKGLVEKKKELGERLLAQYVKDYESSRGQSGDIKMLIATQRSGTAADKVSAYSVLVGDNPVANLRSLDALLGNVVFFVVEFERNFLVSFVYKCLYD